MMCRSACLSRMGRLSCWPVGGVSKRHSDRVQYSHMMSLTHTCTQTAYSFQYHLLTYPRERHFPSNQPAPNPVANVFLIDQEHTKAGLDITQDGLNMLLDHIDAFPQLGYALPAFAASDVPVHEGKTNFNSLQRWETSGDFTFELSMLLKYVELNGNKSDPVPYSIRQQLFYQNFCWEKKMESAVLFRASTVLKRRIQEEFHGQGGYASHWTNLPVLLIGSIPSGWAEYVKFLDEGVWRIEKSSSFTNPFLESLGEANFKTLQATQKYHDLLSRATHVLQNNIRTLNSLFKESKKRKKAEKGGFEEHYELLDTTIEDVNDELEGFVKHAGLILARLTRITEAVRFPRP
ncbi:hypothetical protein K469DRAFT_167501 [Zopfia rhizophila CBS 207.26]|uniref:Uncharacterized protein n=1 Tax=Zopfia rhizophila CBS 207.26 TaxID=1314779 RepID=A0A6A6DZ49_9PEZI|nr:hypothetical protein K469DRAFT_167501 [Zopfia rhizophila CBS 207.26]